LGLKFTRVPSSNQEHRLAATTTEDRTGRRLGLQFMNGSQISWDLPGLLFGLSQSRRLTEQGSDTIEIFAACGMKPCEESNPVKVLRQHMLKKAANEFKGFKVQMSVSAGIAASVVPSDPSVGEQGETAIGGCGLEDVSTEVFQCRLTCADGPQVNHPALFPDPGGNRRQRVGFLVMERRSKESLEMIGQRSLVEEELVALGAPLSLIQTQSSGGDEVMDMRMIDQSAAPGVEDAQHSQSGSQPLGVGGQILQGPGTGVEENAITELGMRTNPVPQRIREGEGDEEVAGGQEQLSLFPEPGVGIGLSATRAMPIVTGVVGEVVCAAVGTDVEGSPSFGSLTTEDFPQDLTVTDGHGRVILLQISRCPTEQDFVEGNGLSHARHRGRDHSLG